MTTMKRTKVIIDTDPGHDDAMALMLACKSPELEVLAVTTVAGNSTIENTTRNARFILDFIGRNDIPVFSGASKPLKRDLVQAVVHGKSGLEGIDPTNASNLTGDAVERMLEIIRSSPDEITLVTLGPMTNVAQAIRNDPQTMSQLKQVISMGGAIDVPGNMNRVAEFNIFVDPEAADIVMRFPVKKTLIPLDACNQVPMQLEDFRRVSNVPLRGLLERMIVPYIENIGLDTGIKAALMYDPLTVFFLLRPESCRAKDCNVQIETKGEVTRGMTVVDKRLITDGVEPNVKVVNFIESRGFIGRFIDAMSR